MDQPRPAEVRFYVDADVMALAKVLVPLRSDVTYPGDLGGVGTRNSREKNLVKSYGARLVILSGSEARTTFAQLEVVMSQWRRIEACLDEIGPVAYRATRTSFQAIDLE